MTPQQLEHRTPDEPVARRAGEVLPLYLTASGLVVLVVLLASAGLSDIFKSIADSQGSQSDLSQVGEFVDSMTAEAIKVVALLCPLGLAWGAGAMVFNGRHGPQVMAMSVVAVVLTIVVNGAAQ